MLGIEHYQKEQDHPQSAPVMYQNWKHLLFVHAPLPPEVVQPLVPADLTIDTFPDESGIEQAWVSTVLFTMHGIRPRFLPAVKGLSAFHEFNFRTYVHHEGHKPGIYFFSLDAANGIACAIASRLFGLNYHKAKMAIDFPKNRLESLLEMPACSGCVFAPDSIHSIHYQMTRSRQPDAAAEASAKIGFGGQPAALASLDFFLVERYRFYGMHKGQLNTGRVWHRPYTLAPVSAFEISETLHDAACLPALKYDRAHFCAGVEVQVFKPKLVLESRPAGKGANQSQGYAASSPFSR